MPGGYDAGKLHMPKGACDLDAGGACDVEEKVGARQPRPPPGEDFLSFVLQSFADQGRLMRMRECLQRRKSVDAGVYFAAWAAHLGQAKSLESFHEKVIMKRTKERLLRWHHCARRAAIARIDFEIDSLQLESDAVSSHISVRETSTHESRMQLLLAAFRQARVAERETTTRTSDEAAAHDEIVARMQGRISELEARLQQSETKYLYAARELKSSSDTIGSLCAMYLSKQEEVVMLCVHGLVPFRIGLNVLEHAAGAATEQDVRSRSRKFKWDFSEFVGPFQADDPRASGGCRADLV